MPTETTLAAGVVALLLAPVLVIAAALTALTGPPVLAQPHQSGQTPPDAQHCAPTDAPGAGLAGYDADQIAHAATIVAVGRKLNVPPQGWVVAIAAAIQESGLHNLTGGDRDSLGLFQQRPSQGWGTPAQILDPAHAATAFYRHLLAIPGWRAMSVNDAAQAVQRSPTPTAFARHEPAARALVHATANTTCRPTPTSGSDARPGPSQAAAVAVAFARSQLGKPYRWGGDGPAEGGWDCSGLTHAAYAAAGITIPRTAQTQYDAGPRLAPGAAPQPGDLVFFGTGPTRVTHVGIATTSTDMINAPYQGALVRIDRIDRPTLIGITRPSTPDGGPV